MRYPDAVNGSRIREFRRIGDGNVQEATKDAEAIYL